MCTGKVYVLGEARSPCRCSLIETSVAQTDNPVLAGRAAPPSRRSKLLESGAGGSGLPLWASPFSIQDWRSSWEALAAAGRKRNVSRGRRAELPAGGAEIEPRSQRCLVTPSGPHQELREAIRQWLSVCLKGAWNAQEDDDADGRRRGPGRRARHRTVGRGRRRLQAPLHHLLGRLTVLCALLGHVAELRLHQRLLSAGRRQQLIARSAPVPWTGPRARAGGPVLPPRLI